jgi:hypothetical protein
MGSGAFQIRTVDDRALRRRWLSVFPTVYTPSLTRRAVMRWSRAVMGVVGLVMHWGDGGLSGTLPRLRALKLRWVASSGDKAREIEELCNRRKYYVAGRTLTFPGKSAASKRAQLQNLRVGLRLWGWRKSLVPDFGPLITMWATGRFSRQL